MSKVLTVGTGNVRGRDGCLGFLRGYGVPVVRGGRWAAGTVRCKGSVGGVPLFDGVGGNSFSAFKSGSYGCMCACPVWSAPLTCLDPSVGRGTVVKVVTCGRWFHSWVLFSSLRAAGQRCVVGVGGGGVEDGA